ncbi:MAG: hypothetical protein U0235_02080 [Polyangiaceae bacterium]
MKQLVVLAACLSSVVSACTDSSTASSVTTDPPDGGLPAVADGSTLPDDAAATPDGATVDASTSPDDGGAGCAIAGNDYALYGSQLFKVSADLTMSVLVASVTNQNGLPFASAGTSTTGAQIGSALVVADPNCPFCTITLPPVVVNGTVKAEPITTTGGLSAVKYYYSPSVPNNVVVWSGNGTNFSLYDLALKAEVARAGILIGGPGVNCTKLYAIDGLIQPTAYDVRILAECGDGSGPTYATLAHTGGTKVGSNWQQSTFQVDASTQGMAQNPQIELGDLVRGIFVGASNKVYKRNGGTFELDTTVYKQCNPKTGASLPGARPLIPSPRG